jgi:hypothetical protein
MFNPIREINLLLVILRGKLNTLPCIDRHIGQDYHENGRGKCTCMHKGRRTANTGAFRAIASSV